MSPAEITVFTKSDGPLTKRIWLDHTGKVVKDGSACNMVRGKASRVKISSISDLAGVIEGLTSNQAITLGRLRCDLADEVAVTTKHRLNGELTDTIARTGNDVIYEEGQPGFVLFDFDTVGMPGQITDQIAACGGYWKALERVVPALKRAGHAVRRSTSAGLVRTDTREEIKGSDGLHVYVLAKNGSDAVRFLGALHERCWLAGFGWMIIGTDGKLLERSIIDRTVGASERLVFEGAPVVEPPLAQDLEKRRVTVSDGETIDTVAACPPLTLVEQQTLRKMRAEAAQALLPDRVKVREAYIADQAKALAETSGMSRDEAMKIIATKCRGTLLADVVLIFDDPELGNVTVADVLDDPARFEGATLADPIEGIEYGRCKAKVMRRSDGAAWINSFAHGRTTYELKYDARAVRARIESAPDPVAALVRLVTLSDLDDVEMKRLEDKAAKSADVGVRVVASAVKAAKAEHAKRMREEIRERELANRTDPRPQLRCPARDAPFIEQVDALNEIISNSTSFEPAVRDFDGYVTQARKFSIPGTHAFTTDDANADHQSEEKDD